MAMLAFIHKFPIPYTNPRSNCSNILYKSLPSDMFINGKKTKHIDQKLFRIAIL